MRYIKLLGLIVVVALVAGVAEASVSSAAEYVYKIEGGAKLEAGEHQSIASKVKKKFVLMGEVLTIKVVVECTALKLAGEGPMPLISGGTPGTSQEKVEFSGCTATLGGMKCKLVKSALKKNEEITTKELKGEIVTIVKPAGKAGQLAHLLAAKNGGALATIELIECGGFGSIEASVEGTVAASAVPEKLLLAVGTMVFETGAQEITEVETSALAKVKVGLKFAGNPATLSGESEVTLVSGKTWGVF